MKIYSIEIDTDLGRRVIQMSPPLDVDPTDPAADVPPPFRSLPELLWTALRQAAIHGASLAATAPKAEA